MKSARPGRFCFIEDIAAKPYQIDRMLMQLKLAGKLAEVRGIIFGEMLDCVQNRMQNKDQGYTLEEVVLRVVGDLGVPVAYGLRSGHVSRGNITLPFGVRAALNVSEQRSETENTGSSHDCGRFLAVCGMKRNQHEYTESTELKATNKLMNESDTFI